MKWNEKNKLQDFLSEMRNGYSKLRWETNNKKTLSAVRTRNHFHLSCARYRRSNTSFAPTANIVLQTQRRTSTRLLWLSVYQISFWWICDALCVAIERSFVGRLAERCMDLVNNWTHVCMKRPRRELKSFNSFYFLLFRCSVWMWCTFTQNAFTCCVFVRSPIHASVWVLVSDGTWPLS